MQKSPRQTDKSDIVFLKIIYYVALDFFAGMWDNKYMTLKAYIFEMEYSCSPGGVDCWELETRENLGCSINHGEFKTAGEALNYLISMYPDIEHEVDVISLGAYNKIYDTING